MNNYSAISKLGELNIDEKQSIPIIIQARLHHSRKKGNIIFLLMREKTILVQIVCFKKNLSEEDFNLIQKTQRESIVRITGSFMKSPFLIETTGNNFEIHAEKIEIISHAEIAPIQVEDLNQYGEERQGRPSVGLNNRLEMRYMDLRSNSNQIIFKLRTQMEHIIRNYMINESFTEIHTPKLISTASESGAQVFSVNYFERDAYLAQSPQLYKQMLINADYRKVFEIGAVYRAEQSMGNRHLCEFMGLDIEMELEPYDETTDVGYYQVFKVIEEMIYNLHIMIQNTYEEKELKQLKNYYPGEIPIIPKSFPIISFEEGVKWLNEEGFTQKMEDDLNNENEKKLGEIVKKKLGYDIFFLDLYPSHLRPFYTMSENTENKLLSRSYDLIFRGTEIASGAQRINNYNELLHSMDKHKLTKENYKYYLDSFKYGSPPHAGIGIGLERFVALYLNIPDVHLTSLFPRDPARLDP